MTTKYESHEIYPDNVFQLYLPRHVWQTFTPQAPHEITSVFLHGYRAGSVGNIHIRIKAADVAHKPTGEVLASVDVSAAGWATNPAGAWYEMTLDAAAELDADVEYGIEWWCDGANVSNSLMMKGTTTGDQYANGMGGFSTNEGATWSMQAAWDYAFQDWGNPIVNIPTVQTNDADTIDHESAKLHGTLTDDGGEACEVRFQYGKTVGYGTDTTWQQNKVSTDIFEQLIASLDPDETYHFRAQAQNGAGIGSGADNEFQTSSLPIVPGAPQKIVISHPALKTVRVLLDGSEQAKYDDLSDPDQHYIESGLELTVATPCHIEVTTLADQVYTFYIPEAG